MEFYKIAWVDEVEGETFYNETSLFECDHEEAQWWIEMLNILEPQRLRQLVRVKVGHDTCDNPDGTER